jgi:hypothetical protein
MTTKTRFIAPLLAAGAVAAIVAAPDAAAASTRTCNNSGATTTCQSPGNIEIHTYRPQVQAPRIYCPFSSPIPFMF